jgi:hypothetical protein
MFLNQTVNNPFYLQTNIENLDTQIYIKCSKTEKVISIRKTKSIAYF